MKPISIFAVAILALSAATQAAPVDITGAGDFTIKGDYLEGASDGAGVLLLHQCNQDRHMYDSVTPLMQKVGLHTLAIDLRAYGESIGGEYELKKIRSNPDQQASRRFFRDMIRDKWTVDVLAAYEFLRTKMGNNRSIAAIGTSCGGREAVKLAGTRPIPVLALFSSAMQGPMFEAYKRLPSTPTLFITSEEELGNAQPYFDLASHPSNRLIEYKGTGHGKPLLDRDPSLAGSIANWFVVHLNK